MNDSRTAPDPGDASHAPPAGGLPTQPGRPRSDRDAARDPGAASRPDAAEPSASLDILDALERLETGDAAGAPDIADAIASALAHRLERPGAPEPSR